MTLVCYLLVSTSLDFWLICLWRPQPGLVKHGPEDIFSRWANDQQYWSTKSTLYSSSSWVDAAVSWIVSSSSWVSVHESTNAAVSTWVCIWALYAPQMHSVIRWVQLQILCLNILKGVLPISSLFSSIPWPWTIGFKGMYGYIIWVSSMYHQLTMPRAKIRLCWKSDYMQIGQDLLSC